jgi:hypothetical protein
MALAPKWALRVIHHRSTLAARQSIISANSSELVSFVKATSNIDRDPLAEDS